MYGDKTKLAKAKKNRHMMFCEAAQLAQKANVGELWLTHFSPSLVGADRYMPEVRDIYLNSYLGKDGKTVELDFEEE